MAIRPIVRLGDDVLRQKTEPVTEFDDDLCKLIDDMVDTMYAAPGVGLAANQIGVPLDLMIIDTSVGETPGQLRVFANSRITRTEGEQAGEEGCLSVPGFTENVTRPATVWVEFQDRKGEWSELKTEGLMARAVCHETDHLRGILYVDLLRGLKKERILKKISKKQKKGDW
ncbi:MAG: peptide deformylase [Thermoanaerobaculia bacterium]|nr:peptide deformylase [Thermoanaerobaculia bacterium]